MPKLSLQTLILDVIWTKYEQKTYHAAVQEFKSTGTRYTSGKCQKN